MKYDAWNQYHDLYSKDNTKYTFYHDDRTKVTYIAGVDGMTEEWIARIREAHRTEVKKDIAKMVDDYLDEVADEQSDVANQ